MRQKMEMVRSCYEEDTAQEPGDNNMRTLTAFSAFTALSVKLHKNFDSEEK